MNNKTYIVRPQYSGYKGRLIIGFLTLPIIIGLFILLNLYLKIKTTKYSFNEERFTYEVGYVSRNISNLELWRINDVELQQSATQLMFAECSVILHTQDATHPLLIMDGLNIKRGRRVYDLLTPMVSDALEKRKIITPMM